MEIQEFDHTVDVRDPRTGAVIRRDDYILRMGGSGKEYERPPHSGMIYDPTGRLIRDEKAAQRAIDAANLESKAAADKKIHDEKIEAEKKLLMADAQKAADDILANARKEADAIRQGKAK